MNSRERILEAINHHEPDRVPFDVGGTAQTGIHVIAYGALRRYLGMPEADVQAERLNTQTAALHEDFLDRLQTDARFIPRLLTAGEAVQFRDEGAYREYTDEWQIGWRMPNEDGLYFDMYSHPFDVAAVAAALNRHTWPEPTAPWRFEGMRERARRARAKGKLVVVNGLGSGVMETYAWLRGFSRFYMDLVAEPKTAALFLDKVVELKAAYWEKALAEAGEYIDVINETDDLAGQDGPLMSPDTYRRLIKPRHRELYSEIKKAAPHVKLFLHSCGAVREFIPDFIELGVDIFNPIQVAAKGMGLAALKREFGNDITFWGGGIDTQNVLAQADPCEIREAVRRHIDILAPGGGYVFATDHITQADVPPENFVAMWEAVRTFGGS